MDRPIDLTHARQRPYSPSQIGRSNTMRHGVRYTFLLIGLGLASCIIKHFPDCVARRPLVPDIRRGALTSGWRFDLTNRRTRDTRQQARKLQQGSGLSPRLSSLLSPSFSTSMTALGSGVLNGEYDALRIRGVVVTRARGRPSARTANRKKGKGIEQRTCCHRHIHPASGPLSPLAAAWNSFPGCMHLLFGFRE
ncbi:hypothetical protein GALMADRAFT_1051650 [Galerina marginata CBS 339.88]|uniref:Uncharacterized protein n=1 Tax=Galerina marginata (strain CBS 339.88) TaxID=685588 RepID=A0A067SAZ7_GALM3|nr:hypothetical protein GALMADRAFT_1051650 [Galerina marginata CBS 339.88]